jgi:hypothetical protein
MQIASPLPRLAWLFALSMFASGCAGSEPRAADSLNDTQIGSIEGRILHPGHVIPPMRICAIGSGESAKSICVRTGRDQGSYRIDGVVPGDYIVIGAGGDGIYRIGGHVHQVQCIRAPCPEMPVSLNVSHGANLTGIDINGFYDQRDDFPTLPAED